MLVILSILHLFLLQRLYIRTCIINLLYIYIWILWYLILALFWISCECLYIACQINIQLFIHTLCFHSFSSNYILVITFLCSYWIFKKHHLRAAHCFNSWSAYFYISSISCPYRLPYFFNIVKILVIYQLLCSIFWYFMIILQHSIYSKFCHYTITNT